MARARAARAERPTGVKAREAKVLQTFVSIVSRLPFVEQVFAVPGYEGVEIWTIIDAEPFADEPRDQVYDAEQQSWDVSSKAMVLFRLSNRREQTGDWFDDGLPADDYVAWRRGSDS